MNTVTSKDGTTIAYDQSGKGPLLILVGGALEHRAMDSETAQLAKLPLLSEQFTVIHYDRRGRGDSTDTKPFTVEREIEDIEALIDNAGGSAYLFGISSGAALAMEAAIKLGSGKVKKLAMYEAPYNSDAEARQGWVAYTQKLNGLLAENRNADALIAFMMLVGMPEEHVPQVKQMPMWGIWESVAPTLAYDAAALGHDASVPLDHAVKVTIPSLVMDGEASFPFMHTAAVALAGAMPHGQQRTLTGQTHEVSAAAIAPVLIEFFTA
jgi:pimeloyl-ACP methyl ester carboxylesterase